MIVHKAIADRPKDWLDIEKVLLRQRGKLDVTYVRELANAVCRGVENSELLTRFNDLYANMNK